MWTVNHCVGAGPSRKPYYYYPPPLNLPVSTMSQNFRSVPFQVMTSSVAPTLPSKVQGRQGKGVRDTVGTGMEHCRA